MCRFSLLDFTKSPKTFGLYFMSFESNTSLKALVGLEISIFSINIHIVFHEIKIPRK